MARLMALVNAVRSLMSVRVAAPASSSVVAGSLTFFWSGDVWRSGVQAVDLFLARAVTRSLSTALLVLLPFAVREGCSFREDSRGVVQCRRRRISVLEEIGVG